MLIFVCVLVSAERFQKQNSAHRNRPEAYLTAKAMVPSQSAPRSTAGAELIPGQRGIPSSSPPTTERCPAGSEDDEA